jgi:mRNA interferase RelE/StbE
MPGRSGRNSGFSVVYMLKAEDPNILKNNIIKLAGTKEDYYRLRVGNYRVIYEKKEKELIILIIRIGHRREVYQ